MRRLVWIFLAAIVLPSLVLAWLAVHSVRDQQVILEHQQAVISQSITDSVAQTIQQQIDGARQEFEQITQKWLEEGTAPQALAEDFNNRLSERWPLAEIGFAVDRDGTIYSPRASQGIRARQFRDENDRFLSNRENVAVYSFNASVANQSPSKSIGYTLQPDQLQQLGKERNNQQVAQEISAPVPAAKMTSMPSTPVADSSQNVATSSSEARDNSADFANKSQSIYSKVSRRVSPQQNAASEPEILSQVLPEESDFRRVTASQTSGTLARFLNNKLRLLVWYRPASSPTLIFGAQLNQAKLIDYLKPALVSVGNARNSYSRSSSTDYCLVILNDSGQPVALSHAGFKADWKRPFVSTEIGEALPHWEVALYWLDSQRMSHSAQTLQWMLGLIVLVLIIAMVLGGYLIVLDVRRQTQLAQQKTDFVSNVSHELKTPLTSIRMFADLLAENRSLDPEKQRSYLRIITAEAARLTRLINNVLDFARMERGISPGKPLPCELVEIVREVTETCRPHYEANGIAFQLEVMVEALPLQGHRDSLAQILLNLLSNAEKYGDNDILIRVRREESSTGMRGCVDVMDRGQGIEPSQVKRIFEPFQRLEDSLASGIPGSGLGLTLAQRLAHQHGGEIRYHLREGGGSCFTLSVPLAPQPEIT
ncbi:MAG: hypothetical protein B9S32_01945 [Verrucomicrobia bacterium Tous-C9LFEB]|nr:MAG: hypothetical protein B9S32_01945 [Verrucomicrobia bacterium Tous-C9LFEB]